AVGVAVLIGEGASDGEAVVLLDPAEVAAGATLQRGLAGAEASWSRADVEAAGTGVRGALVAGQASRALIRANQKECPSCLRAVHAVAAGAFRDAARVERVRGAGGRREDHRREHQRS